MEMRLPTPEQLERAYEVDMKTAFPPSELKPLENIQAMCQDGCYRPWCLFDGEELAGECFLWLGKPGWSLLDYLCVSAHRRNDGLGSLILSELLKMEAGTVILGECEAPIHAEDPALAERRLGFYARNQARMAGYDTELFGVHYKTLYWAAEPVPDDELIKQHQFVYKNRFPADKYEQFIQIPRDPAAAPSPQVPWDES